jgi:AmmeMemoRadiSam system protein B
MKTINILLSILFLTSGIVMAQTVRPIRDNVGFSWKANEMNELMAYLSKHNKITKVGSHELIAGISPHDDYLYAGNIYYTLYPNIKTKEVVIFGVTHGTVRKAMNDPRNVLIFDDYDEWHGPYGNVKVSPLRDYIKNKLDKDYQMISDKAQDIEHSIEALVPFLQYYNRDIEITPIMVTGMPYDRMEKICKQLSDIISGYIKENHLQLGKDIFFLISTDANHYGEDFDNAPYGLDEAAHKKATDRDKEIGNKIFNGELTTAKVKELTDDFWPELKVNKICPLWCGKYPIPFGLMTTINIVNEVSGKKITGKFLGYSDSWTEGVIPIYHTNMGLTAPFSLKHWVGYAAAGFYLK